MGGVDLLGHPSAGLQGLHTELAQHGQGPRGTLGGVGALGDMFVVGKMRDMDSGRGADDAGDAGSACVDSLHTRWTHSNRVLPMLPPCLASALAPVRPCVCCLLCIAKSLPCHESSLSSPV